MTVLKRRVSKFVCINSIIFVSVNMLPETYRTKSKMGV